VIASSCRSKQCSLIHAQFTFAWLGEAIGSGPRVPCSDFTKNAVSNRCVQKHSKFYIRRQFAAIFSRFDANQLKAHRLSRLSI
jgi:hypothetical protein